LQVYAVDNALARVADPVFYGFVHERKADIGVKVVAKKFPKEAVGVVCLHSQGSNPNDQRDRGVYGVIEYSEMSEELRTAEDSSGQLLFRAAHICINMFSVEYLKKLMDSEFQLEFHPAIKRISHIKDPVPGKPNGIKLEQFIFDAFKYCDPKKVGSSLLILLHFLHSLHFFFQRHKCLFILFRSSITEKYKRIGEEKKVVESP
jgi:UDP-N-acetylglucosamine/UDP-N-acetylgalactosamine diphosphorylase